MDLSKLPRLSNSDLPPIPVEQPPVVTANAPPTTERIIPDYKQSEARPQLAEAWVTMAMGIIFLFMFPRFMQWGSSRLFHTHFNEYVLPDGITIVPYQQVHDFWPDLGCMLFGLVLLFDGVALLLGGRRIVVRIALAFTFLATAYNLGYLIVSFNQYGLALVSALAVAFGAYVIAMRWQLLKR